MPQGKNKTKSQNLWEPGMRGQLSTALNLFQAEHEGSAGADETRRVQKLLSRHCGARSPPKAGRELCWALSAACKGGGRTAQAPAIYGHCYPFHLAGLPWWHKR